MRMECNEMQKLFDTISTDPHIIDKYIKVEENLISNGRYPVLNHVRKVIRNSEKIATQLELNKEEIVGNKIAALLHEICSDAPNSYEKLQHSGDWAKVYLLTKMVDRDEANSISNAIKHLSSLSFTKYCTILKFAKAIETSREYTFGVEPSYNGQRTGRKEFSNIKDIEFNIKNGKITLNFVTDGKYNNNELNCQIMNHVAIAMESLTQQYELGKQITMDNEYELLFRPSARYKSARISPTFKEIEKPTSKIKTFLIDSTFNKLGYVRKESQNPSK